jgi:hypothetical protein
MQEYRSGYRLEAFFYEQLGGYEKSNGPLSEYYPTMLKNLDMKYELARWEERGRPCAGCHNLVLNQHKLLDGSLSRK